MLHLNGLCFFVAFEVAINLHLFEESLTGQNLQSQALRGDGISINSTKD